MLSPWKRLEGKKSFLLRATFEIKQHIWAYVLVTNPLFHVAKYVSNWFWTLCGFGILNRQELPSPFPKSFWAIERKWSSKSSLKQVQLPEVVWGLMLEQVMGHEGWYMHRIFFSYQCMKLPFTPSMLDFFKIQRQFNTPVVTTWPARQIKIL